MGYPDISSARSIDSVVSEMNFNISKVEVIFPNKFNKKPLKKIRQAVERRGFAANNVRTLDVR